MTDSTEYELAETLGEAAAHELAAGEMGQYLKQDKLDTHDGDDIKKFLPDYQEVLGHFEAYTGMIDEVREEANDWVPTDVSYREEHLPEGPVSEEHALVAGYVLEKQALEHAQEAIEAADGTEYSFLINGSGESIPHSLSDIAREENEEMREIEDRLLDDDTYDFESEEELEEFETPEDVTEAFV